MRYQKLSDVAVFVTDKISSKDISLENYVTVDSLRQNKEGRNIASHLPPTDVSLTRFRKGDVLVGNIRPYLKKIWQADKAGACSTDVLVFRAINSHYENFLYATLLQNSFFDYMMRGKKGSRMPRGSKSHIMCFQLPVFSYVEEKRIGDMVASLETKIRLNRQINHNLAPLAA